MAIAPPNYTHKTPLGLWQRSLMRWRYGEKKKSSKYKTSQFCAEKLCTDAQATSADNNITSRVQAWQTSSLSWLAGRCHINCASVAFGLFPHPLERSREESSLPCAARSNALEVMKCLQAMLRWQQPLQTLAGDSAVRCLKISIPKLFLEICQAKYERFCGSPLEYPAVQQKPPQLLHTRMNKFLRGSSGLEQ